MTADANNDPGRTSAPGLFTTTHWSLVGRAQDKSESALNSLFQSYRDPLLIWLRARHYSPHDAEDLVQSFVAGLLRRDFLKGVGREKGKFRTFLLTSLKNHLSDARDQENALKRGGGQTPDSLQETDGQGQPLHDPAGTDSAPDLEYDRAWGRAVLARGLQQLEAEAAPTGHRELCQALEPALFKDDDAASYCQTAERFGMSEENVKVVAFRLRKRLAELIGEEIRQTVTNEKDWREEIRYLISLFEK